ncbi:hypothetical protein J6590_042804 [Homalodisca vitripennis]|nr:hypothetical protein J6590_042804 [Homalodisca vitripennis]
MRHKAIAVNETTNKFQVTWGAEASGLRRRTLARVRDSAGSNSVSDRRTISIIDLVLYRL